MKVSLALLCLKRGIRAIEEVINSVEFHNDVQFYNKKGCCRQGLKSLFATAPFSIYSKGGSQRGVANDGLMHAALKGVLQEMNIVVVARVVFI